MTPQLAFSLRGCIFMVSNVAQFTKRSRLARKIRSAYNTAFGSIHKEIILTRTLGVLSAIGEGV
jgi:hypothetical protein